MASSPVPLSPAEVFAAALHATRTVPTAHGPTLAQVEMVLAAMEFAVHVTPPPADVRHRLLACRRSCGSSALLDGVLSAAVSSLAGGDIDAVKRAGKFVVTGLKAHGCRGHDDTTATTAPDALAAPSPRAQLLPPTSPSVDVPMATEVHGEHNRPRQAAVSRRLPHPSAPSVVGKGKGPAQHQPGRNDLRRPRSPAPRRLASSNRPAPSFTWRSRCYPTAGGASGRSRSTSPERCRQRTRSPARMDGGGNIVWFPRVTFGPFKSLPLHEQDLASLDDGSHLSRALVDGVCHWLLTRLRGVLPTDGGLRLLCSTVADEAPRAARGDFDSANRGVEAMRRNSVFFACTTVLPFMSGSSWSAVIIHGLNAIVPHVRHAMGLQVAPAKAATAAEMVVILSQQDENASYDVAYINGIYRILATTFAYVHMKGRGARKNTLAVERVFRRVLPVVVRRLPYPTKSFRAGENIISYLAFYMSAHPTGAARLRSTDKLWTQSAPLAEARQAVRDLVTAQRRRDDAVENNVAAVLLCGANLHGEDSTSGDDDASGGTPPPPPKPDGGNDAGSGPLRDSGSSAATPRSDRGDAQGRDSGGQGGGGAGASPKAGARSVGKKRVRDTSQRRAKVMAVGGSLTVPGGRDGGGLTCFHSRSALSGMSAAMALPRLDHRVSAAAHDSEAAARSSGDFRLLLPRRTCTTPPHAHAFTHEAMSGRSSLRAGFAFFRGAARGFPSDAPAAGSSAVTLTFPSNSSPVERCASASARFQGLTIMGTAAYSGRKNKEPLAPTLVAASESTVANALFGSQAAPKPLH